MTDAVKLTPRQFFSCKNLTQLGISLHNARRIESALQNEEELSRYQTVQELVESDLFSDDARFGSRTPGLGKVLLSELVEAMKQAGIHDVEYVYSATGGWIRRRSSRC